MEMLSAHPFYSLQAPQQTVSLFESDANDGRQIITPRQHLSVSPAPALFNSPPYA